MTPSLVDAVNAICDEPGYSRPFRDFVQAVHDSFAAVKHVADSRWRATTRSIEEHRRDIDDVDGRLRNAMREIVLNVTDMLRRTKDLQERDDVLEGYIGSLTEQVEEIKQRVNGAASVAAYARNLADELALIVDPPQPHDVFPRNEKDAAERRQRSADMAARFLRTLDDIDPGCGVGRPVHTVAATQNMTITFGCGHTGFVAVGDMIPDRCLHCYPGPVQS